MSPPSLTELYGENRVPYVDITKLSSDKRTLDLTDVVTP